MAYYDCSGCFILWSGFVSCAYAQNEGKDQLFASVTEVNLEEGEMLTYQVEQRLEIRGGDVQKGI